MDGTLKQLVTEILTLSRIVSEQRETIKALEAKVAVLEAERPKKKGK